MEFGKRLKELRDERKVTQADLAGLLNVVRPTIAGYETRGKEPDFDKIRILCDFFNVTSDYLLGISDNKNGMAVQDVKSENINASHRRIDVPFRDRLYEILEKTPIDELSRITQIPIPTIKSFLTTNGPEIDDLRMLSYTLHVSIDYLLGGSYYQLNDDEEELIQYYRTINKSDKRILMGEAASIAKPYIKNAINDSDFDDEEKIVDSKNAFDKMLADNNYIPDNTKNNSLEGKYYYG